MGARLVTNGNRVSLGKRPIGNTKQTDFVANNNIVELSHPQQPFDTHSFTNKFPVGKIYLIRKNSTPTSSQAAKMVKRQRSSSLSTPKRNVPAHHQEDPNRNYKIKQLQSTNGTIQKAGSNYVISQTPSVTQPTPHTPRSRFFSNQPGADELDRSNRPMRRSQSASRLVRVTTPKTSSSLTRYPASRTMTSFTIGRPAQFGGGAYGDLSVFRKISQVNDHLFICGVMALSEEKLKALRIDLIVNATLDWPFPKIPGIEGVRVAVDDIPTASLLPYFDKVADKINQVISRGGRVLVHCMAGVSRSCSLCIGYLMKWKGMNLKEAYRMMQGARAIVRPNDGFWRQLGLFERQVKKGKTTSTSSEKAASKPPKHEASSSTHAKSSRRSSQQANGSSTAGVASGIKTLSLSATGSGQPSYENNARPAASSTATVARQRSTTQAQGDARIPHRYSSDRNDTNNNGAADARPSQAAIAISALKGSQFTTTYGRDFGHRSNR